MISVSTWQCQCSTRFAGPTHFGWASVDGLPAPSPPSPSTAPSSAKIWRLRSDGHGWHYSKADGEVVAVELTAEQAWRLLSNNYRPDEHGRINASGDLEILDVIDHTRAIIGVPK